jgi:hypothetical protein
MQMNRAGLFRRARAAFHQLARRAMPGLRVLGVAMPLLGAAAVLQAANGSSPMIVTASNNASANQLLVFDPGGNLVQTVSAQGLGGVGGNAGGIEAWGNLVAVVNFGSQSVSLFERMRTGFTMLESIPTASSPVSVAFNANHLYILGTTTVESHRMYGSDISQNADGVVTLLKADGSAAQVGVVDNQLVITEKSNTIETVGLLNDGAVTGSPVLAQNIPANVNAPFGLVTRGNDAYVTIAHANEISLVRNGQVLTVTGSGTQSAPCWLALAGPFLFSSNSPSMSVSRYAVYGQKIVQDAAVAAQLKGAPTDIAAAAGWVAVVDGNGTNSHLSIFVTDEDGNLTLQNAVTLANGINGVAIVPGKD